MGLALQMEEVFLDLAVAIPCGLVINELVTNALKHAFGDRPSHPDNQIAVKLEAAGPQWRLTVSDNGRGGVAEQDWQQSPTLGLRLVRLLAQQLKGTLRLEPGPGCRVVLEFPQQAGRAKGGGNGSS